MEYTYSYSGSDCRVFANYPDNPRNTIELASVNTISISVYESKSPVRALGYRNVKGFTNSLRTIGGSMILTVVKDHPLRKLARKNKDSRPFSEDKNTKGIIELEGTEINRLSTMLEPFNLRLVYVNEVQRGIKGNNLDVEYAVSLLENIHIVNESIVSSVNDMVTEIAIQFVAENFEEFTMRSKKADVTDRTALRDAGGINTSEEINESVFDNSTTVRPPVPLPRRTSSGVVRPIPNTSGS